MKTFGSLDASPDLVKLANEQVRKVMDAHYAGEETAIAVLVAKAAELAPTLDFEICRVAQWTIDGYEVRWWVQPKKGTP